jgi:hypothetical protein
MDRPVALGGDQQVLREAHREQQPVEQRESVRLRGLDTPQGDVSANE